MISDAVSYLQSLRRRDAGEVGAWIWKAHYVTCFSDEKFFRIDAVVPIRRFHTFHRGKQGRRNNATPFSGYTMQKRWVALLRRPMFEPLFTTHPSEVGSATPWTVLAAMLRGPLSHPMCRPTTFLRIGLVIFSSLSPFQQMCHLIPWLTLATNCT